MLVPLVVVLLALAACGGGSFMEEVGATRSAENSSPGAVTAPPTTDAEEQVPRPETEPGATAPAPGTATAPADVTRFAVVGDSITAGFLPLRGTTVVGAGSWIPAARQHPQLEFAGGWAVPGATTTDMLAGVRSVDADVLIVLAGTNDLAMGTQWPTTESNLLQIVGAAGVPTVVLSAIPPRDDRPAETQELNGRLRQLATSQGWSFVDPWGDMASEGTWVGGTSMDGIHPTDDVAALVGQRLAAAVAAAG
ncbi:Lysophospholipase L1 [Geodermatophilus ruber]|uniref:Lysophospholipase L1 n=1 Tax=Geodermatophilus ruber TaxID=504800 RepID=A0A1I4L539_9ACTN|nr:Lysophospholipase L1 [Geodermatophilus ruber]